MEDFTSLRLYIDTGNVDAVEASEFPPRVIQKSLNILAQKAAGLSPNVARQILDALVKKGATTRTNKGTLNMALLWHAPAWFVEALLELPCCDPNTATPLFYAITARTSHALTYVRALLQHGADPNGVVDILGMKRTDTHMTPELLLHEAITMHMGPRWDVVCLLLQYGADPYACDSRGLSCLHWARHTGFKVDFFEDLEECRRRHTAIFPRLQKELMEAVWHPTRLATHGYFSM